MLARGLLSVRAVGRSVPSLCRSTLLCAALQTLPAAQSRVEDLFSKRSAAFLLTAGFSASALFFSRASCSSDEASDGCEGLQSSDDDVPAGEDGVARVLAARARQKQRELERRREQRGGADPVPHEQRHLSKQDQYELDASDSAALSMLEFKCGCKVANCVPPTTALFYDCLLRKRDSKNFGKVRSLRPRVWLSLLHCRLVSLTPLRLAHRCCKTCCAALSWTGAACWSWTC